MQSKPCKESLTRTGSFLSKWQLAKIVETRRYGFAFEVTTMDRVTIFRGAANSGRQSIYMATQEAMVEAIFKAKDLGLGKILILSNHKKLVQICNFSSKPSWQDQALLSDLCQLKQQSYVYLSFLFLD